MNKRDIHVGDLVVEVAGNHAGALRSGSTSYACAICVSADPFVLASEEGDMLWHNADKSKLMAWRAATADEARQAFNRFHKRGQWAPDYKTNPNYPHQFPTVAEFKLEDRVRVNWPGDGGYTVYEVRWPVVDDAGLVDDSGDSPHVLIPIANFVKLEDGTYERDDG